MKPAQSLVFAKVFYFAYFAAGAALIPYLPLYYQSLGFSGSQIGLLTSLPPLVTLFGAPFWGGLADAVQHHKGVLLGVSAGAVLAVLALMQASSLWLLGVFAMAYAFFNAPIMPLVDNSVLSLLGEHRADYGKQRLWGAIGWGLSGPVVGWLTEEYGLRWFFIAYLLMMSLGLLVSWNMTIHPSLSPEPFWKGLRQLLSDRRWLLFLAVVFVAGAGFSMVTNFLFLFLNEMNASRSTMGLTLLIATISELPVLFYSGWMLQRWGARGLIAISLSAYILRALGYSFATAPWQILIFQLLHGLNFSALWVAGVSFAREIAPQGLGATAQGMFSSTLMGLGSISGALIGGLLFEKFHGAGMYRFSGLAVLLGLLFYQVAERRLRMQLSPSGHNH